MRKVRVIASEEELQGIGLSPELIQLMLSGHVFGVRNYRVENGLEVILLDHNGQNHFAPQIFATMVEEVLK